MKLRRVVCVFMSVLAVFANSFQAYCAEPDDDSLLGDIGTPHDVIESMDEEMKEYICENMDENERFESFECKEVADGNTNLTGLPIVSTYSISENDMRFTLYATSVKVDGKSCAKIYASFKWNKSVAVKNDTFAVAVSPGWETYYSTQQPKLTFMAKNGKGVVVASKKISPSEDTSAGIIFHIDGNGFLALPQNSHYTGYTNFYAVRKKNDATKRCSVKYVHDASSNFNISYGLSISRGPVSVSISVTGNRNKLDIYTRSINFSYSTK